MAVLSFIESWEKTAGSTSTGEPNSGQTTATRKFTVTFDVGTLAPEILAFPGVPQTGEPHTWGDQLVCRGCRVRFTGPASGEVTANYERARAIEENEEQNSGSSPLDEPAQIRVGTTKTEAPVDEDINGEPIVTVNNEPIYGVTRQFSDTQLQITKNLSVAQFALTAVSSFNDHVNSAAFLGFPPGRLKLDDIQAEQVNEEDLAYWRVTAVILDRRPVFTTDERAWWKRVRHEGFRVNNGTAMDPKIENAVDRNADPVTSPVLLDENGMRIEDVNNAHWLEFEVFPTTDFNSFGIYP